MGSRFFVHLRAQWMGALALFLVIAGGTAYAANTVGSTDIINGQVKSADIGTGQVQSIDVNDDSLVSADVARDSLNGADIFDDSLKSSDIGTGAVGASEIQFGTIASLMEPPYVNSTALDTTTVKEVTVPCHFDIDEVTGGGFVISGPGGSNVPSVAIQRSYAVDQHTWLVRAVATSGTPTWQLTGIASCVD